MMLRAVVLTLLLAACSAQPEPAASVAETDDALGHESSTPAQTWASLPLDEVDAQELVESLGPGWRNMIKSDRPDSFSGGYRIDFMSRDRSYDINTLANGQVWNIQLRSGMGDRCGSAEVLAPTIDQVLAKAAPALTLTSGERQKLKAGLRGSSIEQIEKLPYRVTTVDSCIFSFDVRTVKPR